MPVSGSYSWKETSKCIELIIPLKGAAQNKIDIFIAETILKVSFPPFLVDLNLANTVDDEKSKAILKNCSLYINLVKKSDGLWGNLVFNGSKGEIERHRTHALEKRQQKEEELQEKAEKRKWQEERSSLKHQVCFKAFDTNFCYMIFVVP